MNAPLDSFALIFVAFGFGAAMLLEASLILQFHRQMLPMPSRILRWVLLRWPGQEKAAQKTAESNTPENLRAYAIFAAILGGGLIFSGCFRLLMTLK